MLTYQTSLSLVHQSVYAACVLENNEDLGEKSVRKIMINLAENKW
jgi:hypothetical protein